MRCASVGPPFASDGPSVAKRTIGELLKRNSGELQEKVRKGAIGTGDAEDQEAEGGEEEAAVGEEQGERRKGGDGKSRGETKRSK